MFDNKDAQFITILLLTCLICFLFSSKVFSASYDQFFGTTSSFIGPTAGGSFGFAPGGFGFGGPSFSFGPSMNMGFNFGAPTGFGTTNYSYGMPQTMGFGFTSPALSYGTSGFNFGAPTGFGTTNYSYGMPQTMGFGFASPALSYGMPQTSGYNFAASTGFGAPNYSYGLPQTMGFGFTSPALSFGLPTMGFGFASPSLYGTPLGINYNPFAFPQSQQTSTSNQSSQSTTDPDYPGVYLDPLPEEIPNVKGYWSGQWESFATNAEGEVLMDANGQILIDITGDIKFHFTTQNTSTGIVEGTVEITGWDVSEYPDWEGDDEEVKLSGYVDEYNKWFFASYFNFEGAELLDDYSNLISHYSWTFNNVTIMDNWFYGQFMVKGTDEYEIVGKFRVTDYVP